MSIEGGNTIVLRKYREWIYGIGVVVVVVTFYLLIMRHDSSGPFWAVRQIQRNLKIWSILTSVIIILMALVGYSTRSRK